MVEPFPSFVVPHASYRVPVAREQIISEMGAYAGAHWGTWESARGLSAKTNPRFHFTAQPTARTAWTTRAHADQLSLAERLDSLYNRCRVAFTDPFGDQRYVTVVRVNPYLDPLGLTRTLLLETGTFTAAAATALANTALDLAERAGRIAGQITLRGDVGADAGPKPAALLKAGRDRLAITDLPALEGLLGTRDNEFHVRRVDTTLGAAGPSTTAELGIGADPLEVLQARLAARTGVITGEVGR